MLNNKNFNLYKTTKHTIHSIPDFQSVGNSTPRIRPVWSQCVLNTVRPAICMHSHRLARECTVRCASTVPRDLLLSHATQRGAQTHSPQLSTVTCQPTTITIVCTRRRIQRYSIASYPLPQPEKAKTDLYKT